MASPALDRKNRAAPTDVLFVASGRSDDLAREVGEIETVGDPLPPHPADLSVTTPATDPGA